MAIMHPKNVFRFNSLSEEKIYNAFKEQLSDRYEVFYSVVWYSKDEKKRRINSESDFIIVDRDKGFICVEVKGGIKYTHEDDLYIVHNLDGNNIVKRISAFQQAENSMRYFLRNYEDVYNLDYRGIYGFMAAFPNYKLKDDVEKYFNQVKDVTIDIDDMNNIDKCVKKAFLYWENKNSFLAGQFLESSKKKLCDMFKRSYAIEASKGSLIEYKNAELDKINEVQNNIINLLSNYHVFAMKGAAGTGKSWIAYKIALLNAIGKNRKTLLVSKSPLLASYFRNYKNISKYKSFDILSFNELLEKIECDDINNYEIPDIRKYGVIIVDEGQDFSPEEAFFIRNLLIEDGNGEFYLFYDDEQNIYENDLQKTLNNFIIDTPPYILTENLRNTRNIYDWAKDRTSLGMASFSNQIDGPDPLRQVLRTINQIEKYLNTYLTRLVEKDEVPFEFINIVIDDDLFDLIDASKINIPLKNKLAAKDEKFIGFFKTSEYKGLESNVVFYIHKESANYNYEYVGLTRARFFLYDICLEDDV